MPRPLPKVPDDWTGSAPEFYIYWALCVVGYSDKSDYQVPQMGGRLTKGGTVLDFYIPSLNLAIMVQSVRFHLADPDQRQADALIKAQLTSMGMSVIYIDEEDALRNPIYYVTEAIAGVSHSEGG